jgi:hypothetical protein
MAPDTGLLAGLDVLDLEVAAVGDDVDPLDVQNLASRFCGLRQQTHVHDLVGHRLLDDQLVLGVDRDLNVAANADLGMRGHGAAVGIGQRDLVLAGSLELSQHRVITPALLAERCDLLGQVLGARTSCPFCLTRHMISAAVSESLGPVVMDYVLNPFLPKR